jgi:lysophospholipase L1-like esterase
MALHPALVLLLLLSCCGRDDASAVSSDRPVRIMPFGDSITVFDCRLNAYTTPGDRPVFQPLETIPALPPLYPQGTFFVVARGGYRGYLGQMLSDPAMLRRGQTGSMPSWSFVGSQFLCGSHEGHAGQTVSWLGNITTRTMTLHQPDVVLFMAGTNDFFWPPPRGSRSPSEVASRLRLLLDRAFAAVPNTTFLLSTVPTIDVERCKLYHTARWHPGDCPSDMPANIDAYNHLLPGIAAEYKAQGFAISLHDVNAEAGWVASDRWIWGIHFNASGFEKMARSWHKALMDTTPMRRAMRRQLKTEDGDGQPRAHAATRWRISVVAT